MVTVVLRVPSPAAAEARVRALAVQRKGSAQTFTDYIGTTSLDGVLAFVPYPALEGFLEDLGRLGSASREVWRGESDRRQERIEAVHVRRLKDLLAKREELLKDFMEDAPAVKDVDIEIAEARKQFARLRAPGGAAKMAAVRITLEEQG
jgi:hypothetical protein